MIKRGEAARKFLGVRGRSPRKILRFFLYKNADFDAKIFNKWRLITYDRKSEMGLYSVPNIYSHMQGTFFLRPLLRILLIFPRYFHFYVSYGSDFLLMQSPEPGEAFRYPERSSEMLFSQFYSALK